MDEKKENLIILVLSVYYEKIAGQLKNMGFIENIHFFNGLNFIDENYCKETYSQEGEDIVLREFLKKENGFYVDIGAYNPVKHSNTYYFYKRGWRGINIEPMPNSKRIFDLVRPNDINLEIGISSSKKHQLTYFVFNDHAVNTCDENLAISRVNSCEYWIEDKITIAVKRLSSVLDKYLNNKHIDFMSIDVEGYEIDVLKSNDWSKYKPDYLLVESLLFKGELINIKQCPVYKYLSTKGYSLIAKTYRTCFYKLNDVSQG